MTTAKALKFVLRNGTKGAWRYMEVDDNENPVSFRDAAIGTVYIRKTAIGNNVPNRISVTVQVRE